MKIKIQNTLCNNSLFQVPDLNFGQLQRWEKHEQLTYKLEIELSDFVNKIQPFFNEFRTSEIEEDDVMDFTELIAYKNLGFPTLTEMLTNHEELLSDLLIFNAYEILQVLFEEQSLNESNYFYSINSIDEIDFTKTEVLIKGICFKVVRDKI